MLPRRIVRGRLQTVGADTDETIWRSIPSRTKEDKCMYRDDCDCRLLHRRRLNLDWIVLCIITPVPFFVGEWNNHYDEAENT